MTTTATILLIISAFTHAGWNFVSKNAYPSQAFYLVSMNHVENVSYVAAFRQLSIPLGAIFGMTLLGEPRYLPKRIGIAAIFIGLVFAGIG
jgi:uncharacterized membrane protein